MKQSNFIQNQKLLEGYMAMNNKMQEDKIEVLRHQQDRLNQMQSLIISQGNVLIKPVYH